MLPLQVVVVPRPLTRPLNQWTLVATLMVVQLVSGLYWSLCLCWLFFTDDDEEDSIVEVLECIAVVAVMGLVVAVFLCIVLLLCAYLHLRSKGNVLLDILCIFTVYGRIS